MKDTTPDSPRFRALFQGTAAWAVLALLFLASRAQEAAESSPADFSRTIARASALAEELVASGDLPGLSVALVEGDRLVWSKGFGFADVEARAPATAATVYRVGSISKLFTALAAMQLLEEGRLDLDRPLAESLPDLGIDNPFLDEAGPVKLRHVFSHASGLPREPPVGSYFDDSGVDMSAVLRSCRGERLVHPPGRVTKYSNLGVSLIGTLVERIAGVPFEEHTARRLLEPMGMKSSSFRRGPAVAAAVAKGYMQGPRRSLVPAPVFELGTVAAGNLYSTVEDLARLARMLHGSGEVDGRRIVKAETLERMAEPQFPAAGGRFGIGFALGERGGEKSVEHNGAVYGYSSVFICLRASKLSLILLANEDVAFGPLGRLTNLIIREALASRRGAEPPPVPPELRPARPEALKGLEGVYRSETARIELRSEGDRALLVWNGHPVRLEAGPDGTLVTRDRLLDGDKVSIDRDAGGRVAGVRVNDRRFLSFDPASAPAAPREWEGYAGDYGPRYLPVRVRIREGRLVAECETFEYEPAPREDGSFVFPRGTLYEDEALRFHRGPDGSVDAITLGTMRFTRLPGAGL